jgi:transcriptional regulator with XRE-family HTH domain
MTNEQELLLRVGGALYGDRWQSDMAHVLGVNVRTVQRWLSGEREPGPETWTALRALVLRRIPMLAAIDLELSELLKTAASSGLGKPATYRLQKAQCPWCEHPLDAATSVPADREERNPEPGDLTVCLECASLLMFDQGLIPQKVSEDERRKILLEQPDLVKTIASAERAARSIDRRRGG